MQDKISGKRAFLKLASAGAAVLASSALFGIFAVDQLAQPKAPIFDCTSCRFVAFGKAPIQCPVCRSSQTSFSRNNKLFVNTYAQSLELREKHIPEIFVTTSSLSPGSKEVSVRIGAVLHPMDETHSIRWIDAYIDDVYYSRVRFSPGASPAVANFPGISGSKIRIVAHCSVHGHSLAESLL